MASPSQQQLESPTRQETNAESNKDRSFLGLTAAVWISLAVGVGFDALINHLSNNPHILYVWAITLCPWFLWVSLRVRMRWRWVLWALCLITLGGTQKLVQKEINDLLESFPLNVYPYADPVYRQPLETDFVLENKGPIPMRNITCEYVVKKFVLPSGAVFENASGGGGIFVKGLAPGRQTTLHSADIHFMLFRSSDLLRAHIELEIGVYFICDYAPKKMLSRRFLFFTKEQGNGELKWYPLAN